MLKSEVVREEPFCPLKCLLLIKIEIQHLAVLVRKIVGHLPLPTDRSRVGLTGLALQEPLEFNQRLL